jgi:hypothetical protein
MEFQEEVETLSTISMMLLRKLEPEPEYVKEYIKKVCERIQREGWSEQERDKPWIRVFERERYTLKIGFIHARKGEQITGADLAFELKDKKIVFLQSKKVGSNGRIHFNRFQLQKLIELEWQICASFLFSSIDFHKWLDIVHYFYHRFGKYSAMLPPFSSILPFLVSFYPCRATFYHLIMTNQGQIDERIFHTSEICFTLAGNKSVSQKEFLNYGLRPDEFQRMFWECKVGGPDVREDIKRDVFHDYSMLTDRLVIWLHVEEI